MAANSNIGYQQYQGSIPPLAPAFNRLALVPFQSGAVTSSTGINPSSYSSSSSGGGFSAMNNGFDMMMMIPLLNSSGGGGSFLDPALPVDWSYEEQSLLEDGLIKYANESNIMRYIKIAAMLQEKTVRDVALRCRWMTKKESGKRRKPEEHYIGKKMKERKEKLVDISSKASIPSIPPPSMAAHPFMMHHMDANDFIACEAPVVSSTTRHLLEENAHVFSQISANLATFKLQDNIDLFIRTSNNLMAILDDMNNMPGIMSQMPPLPVTINEELVNAILANPVHPSTSQLRGTVYGHPSNPGVEMKQELK